VESGVQERRAQGRRFLVGRETGGSGEGAGTNGVEEVVGRDGHRYRTEARSISDGPMQHGLPAFHSPSGTHSYALLELK
jgi:hypothetical protein